MEKTIQNILVTGSSGTIGTALCESLLAHGYQVTGLDIRHNQWSDEIDKLTVTGDLRRANFSKYLQKEFDLVIHLAANAKVHDLVRKPNLARDNFLMTFNLLEFARVNRVKKFIYAGSREVYGNSSDNYRCEDDLNISDCKSPYSATKLAGEALLHSYFNCYSISPVILRFSNVYGKYDDSNRVIPVFFMRSMQNKPLVVYGGNKVLDFTYIDDCIEGITLAIDNFDQVRGNVFNISTGTGNSLIQIAEMIKGQSGSSSRVMIKEIRTGEITSYVADITKARQLLGYIPKVDIHEGIRKSFEWYSRYKPADRQTSTV